MVMHAQAVKSLSTEDYQVIEEEHSRLHEVLDFLQGACCNLENQLGCQTCSREKLAACQGQLTSFSYNLTNLSDSHFKHEESIMLSRPHVTKDYEYFRNHRHAHITIMNALEDTIEQCTLVNESGETAEGYRYLYKKASELFAEHDRTFDDPFIQSTI
jgi:hemerythrin